MTTTVAADPSTRKLSEVARHVVVPDGIVDTLWFAVERQCAEWGDSFDAWQDGLGQITLGLREDGTFAATVGGVTWSIPRQVAKTFLVSRIVFALCILFPNLTVLWTAHRTRTATQTFNKLKGLAQKTGVKPYMAPGGGIRSVNGEQEFEFANGSKIMFGAREQGFGRGFDEVDIEVFDEAQILTEKALEDMVAATNQSRFQFGALLFFMGTPPRPIDPGEEFANRRREALEFKPDGTVFAVGEDSLYVECSADPATGRQGGPDLDDPKQVEIANPSVPHRTPWISIKRLRKQLTNPDSWRRKGLGIWDDFEATKLVMPKWRERTTDERPGAPAALGVAVDVDRVWLSVAAASGGDIPHLAPVSVMRNGSPVTLRVRLDRDLSFVASEVARIQSEHGCAVVLDKKGPAGSLEAVLAAAGVDVTALGLDDIVQGAADLYDAVEAGRMSHGGYPELDGAVMAAGWRNVGERRTWARRSGEISMLEAATLAHHVATTHEPDYDLLASIY